MTYAQPDDCLEPKNKRQKSETQARDDFVGNSVSVVLSVAQSYSDHLI